MLADNDFHLALKVVRSPVVLASQLEALIDEDFIQLAVPEQASKVLCLLIAPLTSHKSQLVKLEPVTPANSNALSLSMTICVASCFAVATLLAGIVCLTLLGMLLLVVESQHCHQSHSCATSTHQYAGVV